MRIPRDQLSRVGLDLYNRKRDRRCSTASVHRSLHQGAGFLIRETALVLEGGGPDAKRDEIESKRNEYKKSYAARGLEDEVKLAARLLKREDAAESL